MLGRLILSLTRRNFSKKVVKDHLIDDKIKRMLSKKDKQENSSEPESEGDDFDEYRQRLMSKANSAEKVYRKKMNKDEIDLKDSEY